MKIASYLKQSEWMKNLLWLEKLESTSEAWNSWRVNVKGKLLHIFLEILNVSAFQRFIKSFSASSANLKLKASTLNHLSQVVTAISQPHMRQ